MKIGIIGLGAVGSFIAYILGQSGIELLTVTRADTIANHNIDCVSLYNSKINGFVQVHNAAKHELANCDLIIIAVKANGLSWAAHVLEQAQISTSIPLVYAVNGLPWWLKKQLGIITEDVDLFAPMNNHCWCGFINYINTSKNSNTVIHHSGQSITVQNSLESYFNQFSISLVEVFKSFNLSVVKVENLDSLLWQKLSGNAVISTICALNNVNTEQLLSSKIFVQIISQCIYEMNTIGICCGFQIISTPDEVIANIAKMHSFKPSMLIDVLNQRITEIDELLGIPLRLADKHQLKVPALSGLYHAAQQSLAGEVALA